jgi:hypothetical protein
VQHAAVGDRAVLCVVFDRAVRTDRHSARRGRRERAVDMVADRPSVATFPRRRTREGLPANACSRASKRERAPLLPHPAPGPRWRGRHCSARSLQSKADARLAGWTRWTLAAATARRSHLPACPPHRPGPPPYHAYGQHLAPADVSSLSIPPSSPSRPRRSVVHSSLRRSGEPTAFFYVLRRELALAGTRFFSHFELNFSGGTSF